MDAAIFLVESPMFGRPVEPSPQRPLSHGERDRVRGDSSCAVPATLARLPG